ncbi:MAG TPA: hypothetical protein PKC22_07690 [Rhodocyclaceae bacterium]|nr:hypothetical protein [Rhodocyclaceae bacterium]
MVEQGIIDIRARRALGLRATRAGSDFQPPRSFPAVIDGSAPGPGLPGLSIQMEFQ